MSRAAKPLLRATKAMQFIFYKHAERRNVYYVCMKSPIKSTTYQYSLL